MLITHWHGDHFGGAAEVAQQIPFGTIHQREIPAGDPDGRAQSTFPVQIKPFREIAARREALAPGVVIPLKAVGGANAPKLELRCLGADQKFVAPTAAQQKKKNPLTGTVAPKEKDPSDNANSAVVLLLSTYEEEEYAPRAAECGAAAYIPKSVFGPDRLEEAWAAARGAA